MKDRNQARKFYQNVNKQRKTYTPVGSAYKDRNGDLITNKKEVLMRWEQFFSELLNGNKQNMEEQTPFVFQNNDEVSPPSRTEVDTAIQRLKNNKSAGSDGRTFKCCRSDL